MAVSRDSRNRWIARPVVERPDGTKIRLYVTPKKYGLKNTSDGATQAERRAIADFMTASSTIRTVNPTPAPDAPAAPAAKEVPTFDDYSKTWITLAEADNRPSTIRKKNRFIRRATPVFGSLRLDQIDKLAIDSWRATLASEVMATTANTLLRTLRAFVRCAREHRLIDEVPTFKLLKEPPTSTNFLTDAQTDRVLGFLSGQMRTLAETAVTSGLRIGELLALKPENIDLARGLIHVCASWDPKARVTLPPKGNRNRTVPIPQSTVEVLRAHMAEYAEQIARSGLVFSERNGRHLKLARAYKRLHRAFKLATLPRAGFHLFRHSYASHLALNDESMLSIRDLLGHADLSETQRYAHLAPSHLAGAVTCLNRRRQSSTPSATPAPTSAPTDASPPN